MNTILVDPDNNYEVVPDPQELVDAYNKTVPENLRMTVEDQDDLNQMFLEDVIVQ